MNTPLDNNEYSCGVFLDFQKAFETVNHEILLRKLHHCRIRGVTNEWFKSYLNDRKLKRLKLMVLSQKKLR